VYFDASRNCWVAAISIGPGKRKKFYFEKKQDAIKKKSKALRELERGTLATGNQRKLGVYLIDWLENAHKSKLRIGTYINCEKKVRYLVDGLGDVWLQKLTHEQVQDFLQKSLMEDFPQKPYMKHTASCAWRLKMLYAGEWCQEMCAIS
jgi:integrase